jgi:transposase
MEKIDARKLGPEGRETLRKMVLRLKKQSDMSSVELAKIVGVHVRTVQAWLRKARTDGAGALIEKTRGRPYGACRKLTMAQEVWVRQRIVGAVPEQLSLPFALWTRRAIQALVEKQFGLQLSDRLVGKYLKRWGYTAQRPVKQAMEQRTDLVQAWLRERYPAIAARAKAEGALIYWADETAVKEDTNWIRGFAPAGRTPVLEASARWGKLSMISAITNRGEIAFQIVEGTINAERFIEFLERLIAGATSKVFLIVDNLRVHHAKLVQAWLEPRVEQIELFYLPPYAPESNPDEYLNHDFKTALRLEPPSRDDSQLLKKAHAIMQRIALLPERIRSYFKHPAAAYAAQ